MSQGPIRASDPMPRVAAIAQRVAAAGGRALVVGGWVRDRLLGHESKDLDLEIFGLPRKSIPALLAEFGKTQEVGRQFPVWRVAHLDIDVAFPRSGASRYVVDEPDSLEPAFAEAARFRDLTINAIGWDPLTDRHIDPYGGREDLDLRRLRCMDAATFAEDPLRVLRVARFEAMLGARADEDLAEVCRSLRLDGLPAERIANELRRILRETGAPARAFEFLDVCGQLGVLAPVAALQGVAQDVRWHPEGDVFVHTCLVLDQAAALASDLEPGAREVLVTAALCHDLGKAVTTERVGDQVRSHGHDRVGARLARTWLESIRYPEKIIAPTVALVANHLAPAQFVSQGAGPGAYRRLGRKLEAVGLDMVDLERVARADHLGRTTEDALAGRFEAGETFLECARRAQVREGVASPVVRAAELMERGFVPGPKLGAMLALCLEIQDEEGWHEPGRIIEAALARSE